MDGLDGLEIWLGTRRVTTVMSDRCYLARGDGGQPYAAEENLTIARSSHPQ